MTDELWLQQRLAGVSSCPDAVKQCTRVILAALPTWTRPLCWIREDDGDIAIAWNARHHRCDVMLLDDNDNNPTLVVRVNIFRRGQEDDISFGSLEQAIERLKVGFAC